MIRRFKRRSANVRPFSLAVVIALIFISAETLSAQANNRSIDGIKQIVAQVDEQVVESESQGEYSSVFHSELVINQLENPWPAVGIYQRTVRFYFTFGDREKDPYPNRLLKIAVTTKRSARHEYEEYVFNPTGQLVFAVVKDRDDAAPDRHYYFAGNRLIGIQNGPQLVIPKTTKSLFNSTSVLNESRKLVNIFRNSLE